MKGKPKIQGKYEEGKNTALEVTMRLKDWTVQKNKQRKDRPNQTKPKTPQKLNQTKRAQTPPQNLMARRKDFNERTRREQQGCRAVP